MSETVQNPPPDPEETLLRMAVERGWLTAEQVHEATLTRLGSHEKTLLSHVPLSEDQKTRLAEELPEADKQTLRARQGDTTRPGTAPEIVEAMKDPSRRIGRYIVVNHLKSGGMGMVFRAWDPELSRWIALKLMKVQGDPTALAYFEREARLAASLNHPNIAAIYEIGRHEAMPFIAMQFIDGPNLADARKDLKRDQVVRLMRDVSLAVHSAHQAGIVHRDLKPANLMTDSAGRVYVMDFGLAKQAELTGMTSARLSVSGTILGTPAYMPPEQARGDLKSVDAQSDVYSLGATLYDLFTFRPPFKSDSPAEVLVQVLNDEPLHPRKLAPDLPEDLATITLKCLEKDKARRYASARDVADDLERFSRGEPILAHAPSTWYLLRKRVARNRAASIAIAAFALLVAGLLGYFLGPSSADVATPSGTVRRHLWPAGTHAVRLTHDGYDPVELEVTTKPWRNVAARPVWERSEGFLEVATTPPGADVTILVDGKPQAAGKADGPPIKVRKGTHEVRLRLADHEEISAAVYVPPGQTARLDRTLVHDVGFLTVSCDPDEVTMRIGDRVIALPAARLPLPTGRHRVVFEKENHFSRSAEVVIRKGGSAVVLPRAAPGETALKWRRDPGVTYAHASLNRMELWTYRAGAPFVGRILAADLDEDGIDDAVSLAEDGRLHAVSGRTGTILWQAAPGDSPRFAPTLADLDADGTPDCFLTTSEGLLLALSGRDGRVLWNVRPGGGNLPAPSVADLDADGIPDGMVGARPGLVAVSGANGRTLWIAKLDGSVGGSPAPGDVNLDGVPDAVVGWGEGNVSAVSGDTGKILWTVPVGGFVDSPPALADVNGDGHPDAVVGTLAGHVVALSGRDGSRLWRFRTGGVIRGTPAIAHLDGDPVPDFIAGSGDGSIYAASGRDGSWIWVYKTGGPVTEPAAGADLDGDGLADVVVCSDDGSVHAVSGEDGSLLWRFRTDSRARSSPAMSDLDGDGLTDVVVGTDTGALRAFLGRDAGVTWHRRLKADIPFPPRAADLDGDGVEDFVVAGTDWELTALSGATGGALWEVQTAGSVRYLRPRGDLDGDGTPDFLAGLAIGDTVALSGRTGSTLWKLSGWMPGDSSEAGDLDGDGVPDFARVSHAEFEGVSGRTGRTFALTTFPASPSSFLGCADVNGDGRPDGVVVDARETRSMLAVHSGTDGRLLWEKPLAEGPVDAVAWIDDLDGDGRPDVVVVARGGKGVDPMRAHSGIDGRILWERPEGSASSVQFADLNRDGRRDALITRPDGLTALNGSDGKLLWSSPINRVAGTPILRDLDGEGIPDALVETSDGFVVGVGGSAGRPILWIRRRNLLGLHGSMALYGGSRGLSAEPFRVTPLPVGVFVRAGLWDAVLSRLASETSVGGTLDREAHYWKGLASLRREFSDTAISEFRTAHDLGLRSPELHADRLEAELKARSQSTSARDLPEEAVALLFDGRLNAEDFVRVAGATLGERSVAGLLLSFRGEEALKRLASRDADLALTASLKAVALMQRPDPAAAKLELDRAIRLHPYDRALRRQRERLDAWKGKHPLFAAGDAHLDKKKWKEAADEFTRLAERLPGLASVYERRARAREGAGDAEGALADYQKYIDLGGLDPKAFLRRGQFLLARSDFDGALRDFDRAVEIDPDDADARSLRGQARYRKRDHDGAIADFSRAIALEPKGGFHYGWRADARRQKGDSQGALADFDRALELRADSSWLWNNRGLVRESAGDLDGAVADYTKAMEVSKTPMPVHYSNRAGARRSKKDLQGAIEDYTKALDLDASRISDWNDRGLARESLGDLEGAIADFGRAIEAAEGKYAVNFFNRARVRKAKGDLQGAREDLDKVLTLRKDDPEDWNERGLVRYELRDYAGAALDFGRAIDLGGKAAYYFNRATTHQRQGGRKAALADFDRAVELDPENARYRLDRGWQRFANGDFAGAAEDGAAVLSRRAEDTDALFLRGVSFRRQGKLDEALADFDRMIGLDAKSARAFNNRGLARQVKGLREGALADFDRAVELDPKEPQFRINRGILRRQGGDLPGAAADFTAVLKEHPENVSAVFERAETRRTARELAEAMADYAKAIELAPSYPVVWARRGACRADAGDLDGAIEDTVHALNIGAKDWDERPALQDQLDRWREERRKRSEKR